MEYKVKDKNGKVRWEINEELAKERGLKQTDLFDLGECYRTKESIEQTIKSIVSFPSRNDRTRFNSIIQKLLEAWRENEFVMQEIWKFGRNKDFHREYTIPGCKCPKLDNEDLYGTSNRMYSGACPVHGGGL